MTKKEIERLERLENDNLNEEDEMWLEKLNKYAEKCHNLNTADCYETDREVADSIKNINNDELIN